MAYKGSKGWYIQQLKEAGIKRHPIELRKLESYKTYIVRNLYHDLIEKEKSE
ncbi:YflJ family protein [Bacillus sp. S/N-304-OC-R1]|uniref:YflJ family protein n=1 Tax=Bacillus sp. S/N-304-OC-R1 TaxID=2758034 RepID=UPI001C8D0D9B|nr:YflJ family protein [Bacillus sp. S/N-304-OC-R1]MBY0124532.1 YflJ family protein [Bacillus sp. S/N-304-OC-R1]